MLLFVRFMFIHCVYLLLSLYILPGLCEGSIYPYGKRVFLAGDEELSRISAPVPIESIINQDALLVKEAADAHLVLKNFRDKMGFGRALAAPQVGVNKRFVVMKLPDKEPRTLYNPVIIDQSEECFTMWDDCLSFSDKMCCVRRHRWISVKFTNEKGEEEEWLQLDQDLSELLQHEIDHLDGVLALDKAVKPVSDEVCEAVIPRADYLQNKKYYDALVDFSY